jgi:hypothetical protein
MDWQAWIDEGLIEPDETQKQTATETVAAAWNIALDARRNYYAGQLEEADELLREAFLTATRALIQHEGYTPCVECDLDLARKAGLEYFGPTIATDLFSSVDVIDGPCNDGEHDHAVKRGVMACATYAAVVGSRVDL